MPKELEDKLKREAAAKGYTGERADHYVYGSLTNIEKRQGQRKALKKLKK